MNEGHNFIIQCKNGKRMGIFFSDNDLHLYCLSIYTRFIECKNGSYLFNSVSVQT